MLYTVPSSGINMSQPVGSQGPTDEESPPRSMSDRSGSGGGKSTTNKEESGCESSRNNGYENKRLNYQSRETGQLASGPPICPSGNSDEPSHYHSYNNRKADGMMTDTGDRPQSLSPGANGTSKLSNNSLSPKSQQLMDSDSDDVGDSDHNSHPTGTL